MVAFQAHSTRLRVIIVGGGIAGLTLANALQLAGIDFILLEAKAEIPPQIGAGIALLPNGSRILDQMGCYDDIRDIVEPIWSEGVHYESGNYIRPRTDGLQLITTRFGYELFMLDRELVLKVLYSHILDKSKILLNKKVSAVGHFDDRVVVHCTDGSSYEGDILAGADGVHSKIRHEMWRLADEVEPGRVSEKDKNAMFAEYRCLFGISSKTEGMQKGRFDITLTKGTSTMTFVGQGSRVFWFIYDRMDKIYPVGKIPKFTKEDAYDFAESICHMNLMPMGSVKFHDLWENRLAYMLAPLEEAEYDTWAWGRIACIGDGIHKTTPNAGSGGNAAIESAAALANSIKALSDRSQQKGPSVQEVEEALMDYQKSRQKRAAAVLKTAGSFTRLETMETLIHRIVAHYLIPWMGDSLMEVHTDIMIGATMLSFLPTPLRSIQGTMPFNPQQGLVKKENRLIRALFALPFILILAVAARKMDIAPALGEIEKIIQRGTIVWDSGFLEVRDAFYGVQWLDNLWRPVTIAFAQWNLGYDGPGSWMSFTFLTDFGTLYSIFLVESARRANFLTFAQMPLLFGLLAQLLGLGLVSHVYFFLHYITTPIEVFRASDNRLTNLAYTRTIFPAMLLCFYAPLYLSYLVPSFSNRIIWNWIWQMFPVWVTLFQMLAAFTIMSDTITYDRIHATEHDWPTIRFTVGSFVALSAAVWIYSLPHSPFSLNELFVPWLDIPPTLVENLRNFIQYDFLFSFGSAFLWLGYLFSDMKNAGMVNTSWSRIIPTAALTTLALGPGAAVGLGWLWREQILATKRHKAAITSKAAAV